MRAERGVHGARGLGARSRGAQRPEAPRAAPLVQARAGAATPVAVPATVISERLCTAHLRFRDSCDARADVLGSPPWTPCASPSMHVPHSYQGFTRSISVSFSAVGVSGRITVLVCAVSHGPGRQALVRAHQACSCRRVGGAASMWHPVIPPHPAIPPTASTPAPVNTHACRRSCRRTSPPSKRSTARACAPPSPPLPRAAQPPCAPPRSTPPPPPQSARLPAPTHRPTPPTGPPPPPRHACLLGPPPAVSPPRSFRPVPPPPLPRPLQWALQPQEEVQLDRRPKSDPRPAVCLATAHRGRLAPRSGAFRGGPRRAPQPPRPLAAACLAAPRRRQETPRREGCAATQTARALVRRRRHWTELVRLLRSSSTDCCACSPARFAATWPYPDRS